MRCEECGKLIPFGEAIGDQCGDCWLNDTEPTGKCEPEKDYFNYVEKLKEVSK